MYEVFRMIGQVANLIPVWIYIGNLDFRDYFLITGVISLGVIPFFLILKHSHFTGKIKVDAEQTSDLGYMSVEHR